MNRALPDVHTAAGGRTLYLSSSGEQELALLTRQRADRLRSKPLPHVTVQYEPMPDESHATIYHPAALQAFRRLFKPELNGH